MCGIYGFNLEDTERNAGGGFSESRSRLVAAVAVLGSEMDARGGHGWGYATGDGQLDRGLGVITGAVDVCDVAKAQTAILHTRYATVGARVEENSHPFRIDHITGAHNGGIWNHKELGRDYGRDFPVDSMHMVAHLAEGKPLDELSGYGAVEFLDARAPEAVGLFRFNGGELVAASFEHAAMKGVLWASTWGALKRASLAAGFDVKPLGIEEGRVYYVHQGIWTPTAQRFAVGNERPKAKATVTSRTLSLWDEIDEDEKESKKAAKARKAKEKKLAKVVAAAKKSKAIASRKPTKKEKWMEAARAIGAGLRALGPVAVPQVRYDETSHQMYLDDSYAAANDASARLTGPN